MRNLFLFSVMAFTPCSALADPQCVVSPPISRSAAITAPQSTTAEPPTPFRSAAPTGASDNERSGSLRNRVSAPGLDHVVASGAHLTEAGTSHGLRVTGADSRARWLR